MMLQEGTNEGIYIGTRNAVYYRNANMSDWELYNTGLPARTHNVKMLPWYRNGKLRTATDRSIWESPFYEPSQPKAIPGVQKQYLFCNRDTAYFTDLSVLKETGATWTWNFPGGSPATSMIRNPKVVYNKPGIYDVSLIVHDVNGTDTAVVEGMIIADNRCAIDSTPGNAMHITAHPGHLKGEGLGLTTQTVTITAWVRPNGIQSDYSAIWMNDGTAAGFNFREGNNTLGYHWPGGSWSWDSNLIVPEGQWSYVAMVVEPGSVKLYVNGVSATHNTSIQSVTLDNFRIGSYQGWSGRTFIGDIDEVCLWNRALSENEIRLLRHLVKDPSTDATLINYYQFDEVASGEIVDKASGLDAVLTGNASTIDSDVPVGSGTSQIIDVLSGGNVPFTNGGDMAIGFNNTYPNGKVVVSHLHIEPDTLPQPLAAQGGYWIINNYGTNPYINGLDSLQFLNAGALSQMMADSLAFSLYARGANAYGPVWISVPVDTLLAAGGVNAVIRAMQITSYKSPGQLLLMRDTVSSGIADVIITTPDEANPVVPGGESISLLVHSDHQAMQMPILSAAELAALGAPTAGQIAFLSDSAALVYYNGTQWRKLRQEPVLQYNATTAPVPLGSLTMPQATAEPSSLVSFEDGLIRLPIFTSSQIPGIEQITPGMLIYDGTANVVRCYNGQEWQSLPAASAGLNVSAAPVVTVPGVAINQNFKHPSSVVDISPSGNKAFVVPKLDPVQIFDPVIGLICFNPNLHRMMIYDGLRWNVLE